MPEAVPVARTHIGKTHDRWERQVALPLLQNPRPARFAPLPNERQAADRPAARRFAAAARPARDGQPARRAAAAPHDQPHGRDQRRRSWRCSRWRPCCSASRAPTAEQRLEREHSLVDALQQTLRVGGTRLPRTEIGYVYASATAEALVGGDLLDSWRDGEETGWFLIADASGKGIQAARHAAFVQYAVRALAAERDDPGSVVARFNRLFIDTFDDPGIFVVLFLGRFDARTHTLRYVGAGHSTAFVRRVPGPSSSCRRPARSSDSSRTPRLPSAPSTCRSGATVVLATDGLTEARDASGTFLGDEGVAKLLGRGPGRRRKASATSCWPRPNGATTARSPTTWPSSR